MTEDEMIGWHHRLKGHEFEQALGVGDGQGTWHAAVHAVTKSWIRHSERTEQSRNATSKCMTLNNSFDPLDLFSSLEIQDTYTTSTVLA